MSYTQATLAVMLGMAVSVGFSLTVHRLVHVGTRREHQDVGVALFLQLGVLFSVLLAFVFSEAYSEYGEAQRAIDLECGALHAAAMVASVLPAPQARRALALEAGYIEDVLDHDWPEMRTRRLGSRTASLSMTLLMQRAARLMVSDAAEAPIKVELLSLLATAHANREIRLYQAANGLPVVLWVVLIGFATLLVTLVALSPVERYVWLTLLGVTLSACVGAILVLVRLLDYPFEGAIALGPGDFARTLEYVTTMLRAV